MSAHLQSIAKTSVKFLKKRNKNEGGVAHKRYILLYGDGRTEGRTYGRTKAENYMYVPPLFFENVF